MRPSATGAHASAYGLAYGSASTGAPALATRTATAGFAAGSHRIDGTVRDACTSGEVVGYRLERRDTTR